jgi:type IV pilus assembly protein PilW
MNGERNDMEVNGSRKRQQGMTVLELMIGVTISMIVIAAGFVMFTSTERSTRVNDQIVETQQNVRIAMDLLSRDIKMAGFGMTAALADNNCKVGRSATGAAAAIVPWDQTTGGVDKGPDEISMVVPLSSTGAPTWTLNATVGGKNGFSQITLKSGAVANMAAQVGGDLTLPTPSFVSIGGAATNTVASVSGDTITLTAPGIPGPLAFGADSQVYLLQCVTYSIGTTAAACGGGNTPCLRRNGAVIADGIEDIQFEYACDGCNSAVNGGTANGIIDDQGTLGNGYDSGDFVTNNAWNALPMTPDTIRMVKVFLVARQTKADVGMGEGAINTVMTATPLVVSDHDHSQGVFTAGDFASLNPSYNRFRRRILTRTIEARNIAH